MNKNGNSKGNFLLNGARTIIGIFLIVLGVIGLFVPILQGFALIIAGIIVLKNKYLLEKLRHVKAYFKSKKQ
jgi:uncharacterized protein YqgC (DUF456 family)